MASLKASPVCAQVQQQDRQLWRELQHVVQLCDGQTRRRAAIFAAVPKHGKELERKKDRQTDRERERERKRESVCLCLVSERKKERDEHLSASKQEDSRTTEHVEMHVGSLSGVARGVQAQTAIHIFDGEPVHDEAEVIQQEAKGLCLDAVFLSCCFVCGDGGGRRGRIKAIMMYLIRAWWSSVKDCPSPFSASFSMRTCIQDPGGGWGEA